MQPIRPIREPSKPSKRMRFLAARMQSDERFAGFVHRVHELAEEFSSTPSMIEDAAAIIAFQMRRQDYATRQMVTDEE